ncbi:tyrosine-type recombinase/integrase [Peribacillus simplex]|uniref:tyrosine-type recombinase/integrase n=1 Tax=Peribacillus simplex TaxID=1478 RepID=UPI00298E7B3D|nr:tyrosine-type recombinase/integrase [Peribacillus simplex]MDW7614319.1 tyrosine-type recombinase/integrase [Peribacillus simplex]
MKQRLVYEDQDFIFAENIGHPRVMKQVVLRLQRLMKHLDVDKHITPHSFRHTYTSLLIEAGAGLKEIQEILGHSDINTPMIFQSTAIYKKARPKRHIICLLGQLLFSLFHQLCYWLRKKQ